MTAKRLVHVIDDEDSVRRSVSFMLKTSGFDVRGWNSGVSFLREVRHAEVGCLLLDIRMPEMDGLEVQAQLSERGNTMPIIMLSGHGDIGTAVKAMKSGAVDFLEKPFETASLLSALDRAFGRLDMSHDAVTRTADAELILAALTAREREVLDGLAKGFPNKTIGYDLGISPRTVEVHRANIMTKLGVRSLSEALRIAFAAGLGEGS